MESARGLTAESFRRLNITEKIVKKCTTGNAIVDTAVSLALVDSGVVGRFINFVISIIKKSSAKTYKILIKIIKELIHIVLRRKREVKLVNRTCIMRSITLENQLDTIFPTVLWYLRKNTDTCNKETISIQKHKDIERPVICLPSDVEGSVWFSGFEVKYVTSRDAIEIHHERTIKRARYTVTMNIKVPEDLDVSDFWERLVDESQKQLNAERLAQAWVQRFYRNIDGKWTNKPNLYPRKIDTIFLRSGVMEDLKKDLSLFAKSKEWYLNKGENYARGYLFSGKPGTGKSSTIRGMATYLNRSIHYVNLGSIKSDDNLFQMLESIEYSSTIIVFEDIDCSSKATLSRSNVVDIIEDEDKQNKEEKDKSTNTSLTLSGILSVLDEKACGRIIVMTTNHIEKLDAALIRERRIDYHINFDLCDVDQIERIYESYFETSRPSRPLSYDKIKNLSPSDVSSLFIKHRSDPITSWNILCDGYVVDR